VKGPWPSVSVITTGNLAARKGIWCPLARKCSRSEAKLPVSMILLRRLEAQENLIATTVVEYRGGYSGTE
jgi:hypothetical protein